MSGCKTTTKGPGIWAAVRSMMLALVAVLLVPGAGAAQSEYYNLDSNRPLRVEDAVPSERRSLDIELAPIRLDAVANARRWRIDPKLSYGIASLTEIELRVPVLYVRPSASGIPTSLGLSTIGISAMRAFNTESAALPALALSGELLVPIGSLAPPNASYALKGVLTKTMPLVRLSVNGSIGTYSAARAPTPVAGTCGAPGAPSCTPPPPIPDVPCARLPESTPSLAKRTVVPRPATAPRPVASCLTSMTAAAAGQARSAGTRWFAGAAIDHTFVFSSTLVAADVFAERLIGFSPLVDWTAEIGLRHQWSPQLVVDAGVSRHFAGVLQSTSFTVGAAYSIAMARSDR